MSTRHRVVRLDARRFDATVATLCAAFHEYPVMRFVLNDAGDDYDEGLSLLIAYFTDTRTSRGWPVLGVEEQGELQAAATLTPPFGAAESEALRQRYLKLFDQIGHKAMARYEAFTAATEPFKPDVPHYYLGLLGVRPQRQGRGYARLLLDAAHEISAGDTRSSGVVLTTETTKNVPLYEHFDYEVLGEAQVEDLHTWLMFRPDQAGDTRSIADRS